MVAFSFGKCCESKGNEEHIGQGRKGVSKILVNIQIWSLNIRG